MTTKTIAVLFVVLIALVGAVAYSFQQSKDKVAITTFEECVAAGNPVMESYPRQCRTEDGRLFVEEVAAAPAPKQSFVGAGCALAGCSNIICAEEGKVSDIATTCEYRAEYACYQSARCEKQINGSCGWTQTPALTACLESSIEIEGKG